MVAQFPEKLGAAAAQLPLIFIPAAVLGLNRETFPCRVSRAGETGATSSGALCSNPPHRGVRAGSSPGVPLPCPGPSLCPTLPFHTLFGVFGAFQSLSSAFGPPGAQGWPEPCSCSSQAWQGLKCFINLCPSQLRDVHKALAGFRVQPFEVCTFRLIFFSRNFSLSPLVEESYGEPCCEGVAVSLSCI